MRKQVAITSVNLSPEQQKLLRGVVISRRREGHRSSRSSLLREAVNVFLALESRDLLGRKGVDGKGLFLGRKITRSVTELSGDA